MKAKLSAVQLNRVSEICGETGQVSLASIVIPFWIGKFDLQMLILGVIGCLVFWYLSVSLARKI